MCAVSRRRRRRRSEKKTTAAAASSSDNNFVFGGHLLKAYVRVCIKYVIYSYSAASAASAAAERLVLLNTTKIHIEKDRNE